MQSETAASKQIYADKSTGRHNESNTSASRQGNGLLATDEKPSNQSKGEDCQKASTLHKSDPSSPLSGRQSADVGLSALHHQRNSIVVEAVVGQKSALQGQSSSHDVHTSAMQTLTGRARELSKEQREHMEHTRRIQEKIYEAEVTCGNMLRKVLELQNAIKTRKLHIEEDKAMLLREQRLSDLKREQIESIVAQIHALASQGRVSTS